ncbi:hypothetical protein BT93_G1278 [Corymbia citriodora subsp. variegata]|nr:hypothetical protein BT93_G1278 [Corymbia citriodora subsp. variegata]
MQQSLFRRARVKRSHAFLGIRVLRDPREPPPLLRHRGQAPRHGRNTNRRSGSDLEPRTAPSRPGASAFPPRNATPGRVSTTRQLESLRAMIRWREKFRSLVPRKRMEFAPEQGRNRGGRSAMKSADDDDDDDDWEGVERSESATLFGRAVRFACSARNAGLISGTHGELTMKLYGLHKAALEGPCREHRPMAFKVSARAKWNAWQRLGNISPEAAMEEYIDLLSEKFPNWMQNDAAEDDVCSDAETFWKLICNLRTVIEQQQTRTATETG